MRKIRRLGRQTVAEMLADMCTGLDMACPAETPGRKCPFRGMDCENVDADRWREAMREPSPSGLEFGDEVTVHGERGIYLCEGADEGFVEVILKGRSLPDAVNEDEVKEGWQ